jgi:hypothetical protein
MALHLNTSCQKLSQLSIGELERHSIASLVYPDTYIEIHYCLYLEQFSLQNYYCHDQGPRHHPPPASEHLMPL